MKKLITGILIFSLVVIGGSCKNQDPGYIQQPNDFTRYTTLVEALRSIGGLRITGGNTLVGIENITIHTRGESTFVLNTQPLFVVNNVPVGTNYSDANSIVDMKQVTSIRVLTGTHAVTRWGEEGNHGVILIKMREAKDVK